MERSFVCAQAVCSMPLWKDGRFVDDDWRIVADDAPLPEAAPAIVSLKRWREQRGELARRRNAPLGLLIAPGSNWERHRRRSAALPGDRRDHPEICRRPRLLDRSPAARARRLSRRDPRDRRLHHRPDAADAPGRHRRLSDQRSDPDPRSRPASGPRSPHYLQPALASAAEVPAGTRPWGRKKAD